MSAINAANEAGGPNTVELGAGCTYVLTTVDNYWYGPNGLPAIASTITIDGNGATIARSSAPSTPAFRLFFVGANPLANNFVTPGAGDLTLQGLTLSGGLAQGGESNLGGGGGAGMGGAIFSQGTVVVERSTITGNVAQGGAVTTALAGPGPGGGGIGSAGNGQGSGGGFGGSATSFGTNPGTGGSPADFSETGGAGGGAGFRQFESGNLPTTNVGGAGGGSPTGLGASGSYSGGTGGDGAGGGGGAGDGAGGGFGFGGSTGCVANVGCAGGGGGVGGGGASGGNALHQGGAGGGGFGGGGGAGFAGGGNGGFGGGGGATLGTGSAGAEGFGGGVPSGLNGGGGAGMGGAVFTMQGQLTVVDSTFTGNVAVGGADDVTLHAQGIGGAVFNLNGIFDAVDSTFAGNTGNADASQIYNIDYDAFYPHVTQTTLRDTIVYDGTGGASDVGSFIVNFDVAGASANVDLSHFDLIGTMSAQSTGAITGTPLTSDPKLGPLQNNGGPTQTMALSDGSPAINAGDAGCTDLSGNPVGTDQRGVARPQGPACDIGAYEVAPPSISGPQAAPTGQTAGAVTSNINPNEQDTTVSVQYGTTTKYGSTVTAQDIGAGNTAIAFTANLANLSPGTTYHAQITATNADGTSTSTDLSFTTPSTHTVGAPTGTAAGAPVVAKLAETAKRWLEGSALARISSARPPVGTTFSFTLDQPATVRFAFVRSVAGRRLHGRCVAQSHANRHRPRCAHTLLAGNIQFQGHSGTNRVRFQGRISRSTKLAPGGYTLAVTATGITGLQSTPHSLTFAILTSG